MIITKQKDKSEILKYLGKESRIFIIGCGECATVCKTGGEKEVADMKKFLESHGKSVTGFCLPDAPCIASQARTAIGKNKTAMKESDALLIMACGLAIQSVKENMPFDKALHIANDTLFIGEVTKSGDFLERCSACGECILELTEGICPVTRCPKGLLNGPCGGVNKSKCEVNPDIDCAWVLIYEDLKKKGKIHLLKTYNPPKDHSKMLKPRKLMAAS
ncbi:MAG: methylenetetrahydrofolate reductase C-terminal domain-containing protein [Candidatus Omnitrophica bacterium]|nr:methylenetetrahydrofolate reductase C-terminal domain-containing protein [Candidatus Omnitrophota bacterium]MBU4488294.1 methylenetetrahydrofolate reductase C-terminal domain-containing protein [Candidatus Omnitrophota bacterium]MCG2704490.1 methylenetetrahydrofolate reductase C-terminal domain-containing protein [Candidatus Omnitrophota bacterium]